MKHKGSGHNRKKHKKESHHPGQKPAAEDRGTGKGSPVALELILKCDNVGCAEAVKDSILGITLPGVVISIIHVGVGDISKTDVFLAETASRLVLGFNVEVMPMLDHLLKEHGVEVRLYDVIYKLLDDITKTAISLKPRESPEKTTGKAKVIALFKSSRKGIILGCEILEGNLTQNAHFRVITAMGPVHAGRIESLQIDRNPIQKGKVGQQVGLKITDFNKVSIGDFVECYMIEKQKGPVPWRPRGGIFRF